MGRLKTLGKMLLWGILVPLLLLVLLAALPIILVQCYFEESKAKKRLRRLRKERAGCVYLICSRRRGWFDFIGNNVAPALPPTVELAWYKVNPRAATTADDLTFLLWRCGGGGTSKPLMMMVGKDDIRTESLHEALVPLKTTVKKDTATQERCRAILAEAMERMQRGSAEEHSTTDEGPLEDSP